MTGCFRPSAEWSTSTIRGKGTSWGEFICGRVCYCDYPIYCKLPQSSDVRLIHLYYRVHHTSCLCCQTHQVSLEWVHKNGQSECTCLVLPLLVQDRAVLCVMCTVCVPVEWLFGTPVSHFCWRHCQLPCVPFVFLFVILCTACFRNWRRSTLNSKTKRRSWRRSPLKFRKNMNGSESKILLIHSPMAILFFMW